MALLPQSKTKAKIVRRGEDDCLLAAFDASVPPRIWQFDLDKMTNHTIMLQEKEGEWDLGLVSAEGTVTPVAHFEDRLAAQEAYDAVRTAMLSSAGALPFPKSIGSRSLWLLGIVAVVLGLIVADILATPIPQGIGEGVGNGLPSTALNPPDYGDRSAAVPRQNYSPQQAPTASTAATPKQEIQTGVPMSADDVLEAPPEE